MPNTTVRRRKKHPMKVLLGPREETRKMSFLIWNFKEHAHLVKFKQIFPIVKANIASVWPENFRSESRWTETPRPSNSEEALQPRVLNIEQSGFQIVPRNTILQSKCISPSRKRRWSRIKTHFFDPKNNKYWSSFYSQRFNLPVVRLAFTRGTHIDSPPLY